MNQGLEVDDYMEPPPYNVSLVHTPADDTLFEGQTWGWYGINLRAVVAQNQNENFFKNGCIPQSLSYIEMFLHCLPLKWFYNHSSTVNIQGYRGGIYCSFEIWRSTTLCRYMVFNAHLICM